jgi:hypothetical protein
MKKLKLASMELGGHEALSREQLKSITGGIGPYWLCVCPSGTFYQCLGGTEAACAARSSSACGTGETATCSQEYSILG